MSAVRKAASTAALLPHATLTLRPGSARGHAHHGWLSTHHTFSFASYYSPDFTHHGALRVLNEDRVAPGTGFPTHRHRDAEIFSYILSGELTHRDSMSGSSNTSGGAGNDNDYSIMKAGSLQFTTGGSGIAHSETNERTDSWVHFLQVWVTPWKPSLPPSYHTATFERDRKREGWVTLVSPLAAGPGASAAEEKAAKPAVRGSIPIHADFLMGAAVIGEGKGFGWQVGGLLGAEVGGDGGSAVKHVKGRKLYVHLPSSKGGDGSVSGESRVRLSGREDMVLKEGDGAFVSGVNAGDVLSVESVGEGEAEVVLFDSDGGVD